MRVSTNMLYNQMAKGLKDTLIKVDDLSEQLATQKKINKPSDDVLGIINAMDYKLSISQNSQYNKNIAQAKTYVDYVSNIVTQISSTVVNLQKEVSSALAIDSTGDRSYFAPRISDIGDVILDLSNSIHMDRYVFSGSQTDQKTHVYDPTTYKYIYQGDSQQMTVAVGTGMRPATITITGATDGSSLIPPVDSTSPFSYILEAAETVTLSDDTAATYTPTIDAATHSINIGVDITHPDHLGDPNYEDTFSFSNIMDMAHILANALEKKDTDGTTPLNDWQAQYRIEALKDGLDKVQTQILLIQGQLGVRVSSLQDQKTRLDANTVSEQNSLSKTEDINMDETILGLNQMYTNLNALRSASARILSQSLFDFLS